MKIKLFLLTPMLCLFAFAHPVYAAENTVYIVKVADAISPGIAEFIIQGINTAEENELPF